VKEAEEAVAAFFHLNRSLRRRRRDAPIRDRMMERLRADTQAARHFWEKQWG
jgi:hypothetical protein